MNEAIKQYDVQYEGHEKKKTIFAHDDETAQDQAKFFANIHGYVVVSVESSDG